MASTPSAPPTDDAATAGLNWNSWVPSLPNPFKSFYSNNADTATGRRTWYGTSNRPTGQADVTTPGTTAPSLSTKVSKVSPLPSTVVDTAAAGIQPSIGTVQTGRISVMTAPQRSMFNPLNWVTATPGPTFNSDYFGPQASIYAQATSDFREGRSNVRKLYDATRDAEFAEPSDRRTFESEVWTGVQPKHIVEIQRFDDGLAKRLLDSHLTQDLQTPTWNSLYQQRTEERLTEFDRLRQTVATLKSELEQLTKRLNNSSVYGTAASGKSGRSSMRSTGRNNRKPRRTVTFGGDETDLTTLPDTEYSQSPRRTGTADTMDSE